MNNITDKDINAVREYLKEEIRKKMENGNITLNGLLDAITPFIKGSLELSYLNSELSNRLLEAMIQINEMTTHLEAATQMMDHMRQHHPVQKPLGQRFQIIEANRHEIPFNPEEEYLREVTGMMEEMLDAGFGGIVGISAYSKVEKEGEKGEVIIFPLNTLKH